MNEHTPGPWRTYKHPHGTSWEITKGKKGEPGVITDGIARVTLDGGQRAEANARLVAAAPDLLEALKEIASYPHGGELRLIAILAIAKAEGRN